MIRGNVYLTHEKGTMGHLIHFLKWVKIYFVSFQSVNLSNTMYNYDNQLIFYKKSCSMHTV